MIFSLNSQLSLDPHEFLRPAVDWGLYIAVHKDHTIFMNLAGRSKPDSLQYNQIPETSDNYFWSHHRKEVFYLIGQKLKWKIK